LLVICGALLPQIASTQEPLPAAVAAAPAPAPATVDVTLHLALGDIHLTLEKERAPVTVANFLHYVDLKRFDGIEFYRAVKIGDDGKYGLLQGGLRSNPKLVFKPIVHEAPAVTGLSHVDGAISMARLDPGTATADFFIIIGNLTSLDGKSDGSDPGYAVFGHVTEGMDIVRQILNLPIDPNAGDAGMKGQMLASPVKILTARRSD
jgi:peptidyl-prolyl cis-trans isomerase A (cyclophilin A)